MVNLEAYNSEIQATFKHRHRPTFPQFPLAR